MDEPLGAEPSDRSRGWRSLVVGAAVVVFAAGVVLVAATTGDDDRVVTDLAGAPGAKEVAQPYELLGGEAFVRPAEPGDAALRGLRSAMDASPAVERYLYLPYGLGTWLTTGDGPGGLWTQLWLGRIAKGCPTMLSPAFVVDLDFGVADPGVAFDAAVRPAERVTGTFLFGEPVVDSRGDAEVYMDVDATPNEVVAVRARLEGDPRFVTVTHLTKQRAYDEFRRVFRDEPDLVGNVSPETLPESFRVTLADRTIREEGFLDDLHDLDGVDDIVVSRRLVGRRLRVRPPVVVPVDDSNIQVYMDVDATTEESGAVRMALDSDPRVASVTHVTKQDAYDEFKSAFRDDPDLVENVSPESLPESFAVRLTDPADGEALHDDVSALPGVEQVALSSSGDADGFGSDVCPPDLG